MLLLTAFLALGCIITELLALLVYSDLSIQHAQFYKRAGLKTNSKIVIVIIFNDMH